jgi:hypothetical protein
MFKKIVRVLALTVTVTVLPGVIVACSGADDSTPAAGRQADAIEPAPSGTSSTSSAKACTNIGEHDDAKCDGGYLLLDQINDESCEAVADAAELAKPGGLTLKLASAYTKGSAPTFSWGKATAKLSPMKRVLDVLESTAHADGRTDGEVYMIVFEDKNCQEIVRAFTKTTSWKADAASWTKLSAAAGPLTVAVVLATLDNSAQKDGTEAKASKPQTFTIK